MWFSNITDMLDWTAGTPQTKKKLFFKPESTFMVASLRYIFICFILPYLVSLSPYLPGSSLSCAKIQNEDQRWQGFFW